jgi:hypothetical protein
LKASRLSNNLSFFLETRLRNLGLLLILDLSFTSLGKGLGHTIPDLVFPESELKQIIIGIEDLLVVINSLISQMDLSSNFYLESHVSLIVVFQILHVEVVDPLDSGHFGLEFIVHIMAPGKRSSLLNRHTSNNPSLYPMQRIKMGVSPGQVHPSTRRMISSNHIVLVLVLLVHLKLLPYCGQRGQLPKTLR